MQEIILNYKDGQITKTQFINFMFDAHNVLFKYSDLLKDVDIAEIKISAEGVLFSSKNDGIKIFCSANDKRTAPFEIMNFGGYETGDADLLYSLINDGDIIFDIGANIGWYTISMAKRFPASAIYAFEPLPATFNNLQKNITINEVKNVVQNNFGFSSEEKTLTFYSSPHTSVSNSARNITGDDEAVATDCKVKRLDDFVSTQKLKIDFIKCDVEGAELFVFEGGLNTIINHKPVVFTEMLRKWAAKFNYHPNNIVELFSQAGYKCFYNDGNNKLKEIKLVDEETTATNFFFLHADKHALILKKNAL
jgi:FkbM family methyltransferase